ncbi:MAG: hypothetical protein QME81_02985 [bacterium]|nr:hypothetical protein [bacterium]
MSSTLEKEAIIELYQDLVNLIWESSSRMIGVMTNNALIEAAIYDVQMKHPFIGHIEISDKGLEIKKLLENCSGLTPSQIKEGFEDFLAQLFGVFASITGDIIIQQWEPRVKEVKEKASKIG